jgi:non-ribosomal peptide synthase protein (TIGR01720 family)
VEQELVRIWQELLPSKQIGIHDDYFELGGDSIMSLQMIARARQKGFHFELKQIFRYKTIARLAAVVKQETREPAEQGLLSGELPLLPIQHWLFSRSLIRKNHFNQSLLLEIEEAIIPEKLKQAVVSILTHHDALRLRFIQRDGVWIQQYGPVSQDIPFECECLDGVSYEEQKQIIEKEASRLQHALNLSDGPLIRVKLFQLEAARRYRLFLVIHHLAIDGYSWRILLEDLYRAYRQNGADRPDLPPKTASLRQWSTRLQAYAHSAEIKTDLPYWLKIGEYRHRPLPLDFDAPAGANTVESMQTVEVKLAKEKTRQLLQEVPASYSIHIPAVLITALWLTFKEQGHILVDLEGHGREPLFEDIDISRTTGWFTSLFPLLLNVKGHTKLDDILKTVKEQLNAVPHGGLTFGLLKYVTEEAEVTSAINRLPCADILFNYLGQVNQQARFRWRKAPEWTGPEQAVEETRSHVLEVNGIVLDEELTFSWNFSRNLHRRATIETRAKQFISHLSGIIQHCCAGESSGFTPSDFPNALVDQENLDELLRQLEQF